jgi:hypothetical protein
MSAEGKVVVQLEGPELKVGDWTCVIQDPGHDIFTRFYFMYDFKDDPRPMHFGTCNGESLEFVEHLLTTFIHSLEAKGQKVFRALDDLLALIKAATTAAAKADEEFAEA